MGSLDAMMEDASRALARMEYLECEALCVEALDQARAAEAWSYVARILLPLQEARRQRRMIAAEGVVRLGTTSLTGPVSGWLDEMEAGCLAVTAPHGAAQARELVALARQRRRVVEVLYVENAPRQGDWRVRSFGGPAVTVEVAGPPPTWCDRWIRPGEMSNAIEGASGVLRSATPADWFLDASEALGDAALEAALQHHDSPKASFDALYDCLQVVSDHEILHQRLAEAARVVGSMV